MTRGEKINQRRLDLKLSQRQLGKMVGITAAFICQIEKGNRSFSIDILIKLSKALKLPIEEIISIEITEDPPQLDRIEEKLKIILDFLEKNYPDDISNYDIQLKKKY